MATEGITVTRILISQTTDESPVLCLTHDLTENTWGMTVFDAGEELYSDLGEDEEWYAAAIQALLEIGEYVCKDGYSCYRTDRPDAVKAQYEAFVAVAES